jgi:hypothetical protein
MLGTRGEMVSKMSAAPNDESATNPRNDGNREDYSPEEPELPRFIVRWFRGFHLHREKPKVTDYLTVGLTLGVAIAAFWSACIFQGQLTEARIATQQSTESFRIDERAWIEIEPIKGTPFFPRTEKIGAAFQYPVYIRNVGKTVARDIQLRATRGATQASIAMGDNAEALNWEQDKLLLGKVPTASDIPINNSVPKVLAPNTSSAVPLILNGQEPQNFPKNQWVSYLIGRVDYTDAFGVNHWMKFCFFVANPRGELWNCKEGNDEDRNSENSPN